MIFLSPEETVLLTGYQKQKCQCNWLAKNDIQFIENHLGHPQILKSEIDNRIQGGVKREVLPHFEKING